MSCHGIVSIQAKQTADGNQFVALMALPDCDVRAHAVQFLVNIHVKTCTFKLHVLVFF